MISFESILTVARYETKTLFRSWFFRIFSILILLFLFVMNMQMFGTQWWTRWSNGAIAANVPYINTLFLNVSQAIIAVFLASDFLRRDKKLDTTEVIYTRPISNGEYVVGKTLGILSLFVGLLLLVLSMALIFNLVRKDIPIVWPAYLYYPLLITVPTLVFILGLAFLLMIVIKNQAVTFVLLLGYIAVTVFYLKYRLNGLLDYMAFNLPMVYSDFIGFADPYRILLHRLAYLFMGTGFIFATIRFLNRLPQVGRWNIINTVGFVVFFSGGLFMGYYYYDGYRQEDSQRAYYLSLNDQYAQKEVPDVVSNDINVIHRGSRLRISSELQVINEQDHTLDTLVFSINPAFRIDSIRYRGEKVSFIKKKQILLIMPPDGLGPKSKARVGIHYSGRPTAAVAYLDQAGERLRTLKKIDVAVVDKLPVIVHRDYVLLTPEIIWYPVAGVRFNKKTYLPGGLDFSSYSIRVRCENGLIPVAAGSIEQEGDAYRITPENDLSSISLVLGPFQKSTLSIDETDINLFLKPGHDYFSQFFTHITDTIPDLIKEEKDDYEYDELDLYYPFSRMNIVETPVQFHAYDRSQVQTTEAIHPEMMLLPERGVGLNSLDFNRLTKFAERRNKRNDDAQTPGQLETRIFKYFLQATFFRSGVTTRPLVNWQRETGTPLFTSGWSDYQKNPYCVFPLYYSYMTGITSPEFPLFNSMMEIYLKEGFNVSMRQNFLGGMSDNEKANMALKEHSMAEIFDNYDNAVASSLVSQTGSFIFMALKNRVGMEDFDNFLYYYLEDHAFREISFDRFAGDFYNEFEVKIEPYFETINTRGKLPAFVTTEPEYILTRDEIGEVYLVRFKMCNTGDVKGIINVTFRLAGRFGPGGGGPNEEQRLYELDPGVSKDVQISLYEQPRLMTVNTVISENIPASFSTFLRSATEMRVADLDEYERILSGDLNLDIPGEIIVDNEDHGFEYVIVNRESKIKQYIDSRKKNVSDDLFYEEIRNDWWWSYNGWTPVAHSACYGELVRSAYLTRRGQGDNKATWTTVLPSAGFYDVWVYIPRNAMMGRPQRGRGQGGQGGQRRGPQFRDGHAVYHYTLSSNEGSEEVEFPLRNIDQGWNRIGAFHFPADTARIQLSDQTNGTRVFADAVKWVMR